jgi:uncharacterized membrane protein YraQ (UPF0718 family)
MDLKQSVIKSAKSWRQMIPIMVGVLLLASLLNEIFQKYYDVIFTGNYFRDTIIGAIAGSFSFGMALTSYIIGGEFLQKGVSLLAVTAFVMTWTTVGIAMLPLEAKILGKKFAIWRNILNFIFAIVISILTVTIVQIIS